MNGYECSNGLGCPDVIRRDGWNSSTFGKKIDEVRCGSYLAEGAGHVESLALTSAAALFAVAVDLAEHDEMLARSS